MTKKEELKVKELEAELEQTTDKTARIKIQKRIRYYKNADVYKKRTAQTQNKYDRISLKMNKKLKIKKQIEDKAKELDVSQNQLILNALKETYSITIE